MNPETEKEGYTSNLTVGGGGTLSLSDEVWVYGMSNLRGVYGGFLPRNQYAGVGFAGGVFADFGRLRLLAEAEKIYATHDAGFQLG